MIWVLLSALTWEFLMHHVHEVSKPPGKRLHQADVRLQASKCSLLPGDLGTWPGFCRQIPWPVCILPARTSHFSNFCSCSAASVIPSWHQSSPSPRLYLYHQPCLVYHATCSTGSSKDAVRTSHYPLLDKEETEACYHKVFSGQAGLSLQLILCFLERGQSS